MRKILITGGAGGIGQAIVRRFAKAGDRVAFSYHLSKHAAEHLVQALRGEGCDVRAFCADLSDRAQTEQLFGDVCRWFGHPDVLVNNAGVSKIGLFTEMTEEEEERMWNINFRSVSRLCRLSVPGMVERKYGKIINISSMWGLRGASCEAVYSASKAAVIGLTQALGKELAPSGISVNAVAPGVIDTPMNAKLSPSDREDLIQQTPACRLGTPEDIAECVFFLASDTSSFLVGQTICADGGFL